MTNAASSPPPTGDWSRAVPKLAELTGEFLFDQIWERPELSKRDRSVITVAVLTALYRTDQLRVHLRRALDNGVTRDELAEIILHTTFYAGWSTGVNGAGVLQQVLDEAASA